MSRLPHFNYLVDGLPQDGQPKPLLLFLHGKGERGTDPQAVRAHGPPHLYPRHGLDRFIVLSPQCPDDRKWDAAHLDEFLTAFSDGNRIDPTRIYLTGLSLGGEGGWHLLLRGPRRFAASILICGRIDPASVRELVLPMNPVWLFHSAGDKVVPVAHSDGLARELEAVGAPVTYTRYRSQDHVQTWKEVYGGPGVFDWLLQHTTGA
jgi:predicted peptidase